MSTFQTARTEKSAVSTSVVEAVAEAEGVAPAELTTPLFEAIDPDALDELFVNTITNVRMAGQVTFSYNGYEVTVSGDGTVCVEENGI